MKEDREVILSLQITQPKKKMAAPLGSTSFYCFRTVVGSHKDQIRGSAVRGDLRFFVLIPEY